MLSSMGCCWWAHWAVFGASDAGGCFVRIWRGGVCSGWPIGWCVEAEMLWLWAAHVEDGGERIVVEEDGLVEVWRAHCDEMSGELGVCFGQQWFG